MRAQLELPSKIRGSLPAMAIAASLACGGSETSGSWLASPDSVGFRAVTGLERACSDCIALSEIATLGTDTVEGFLEDNGTIQSVVRDRDGRYWVGQRTMLKVFAPDGRYLRTVGRRGEGPMEFAFAQPVQMDTAGNVHVFDARLGRETVIGPDFEHRSDRTIPARFDAMAAVPGEGHRYVIAKWATTSGQRALPLHVISGSEIVTSFGLAPQSTETEVVRGISGRVVAAGLTGHIFSSKLQSYEIEAWTRAGTRVAGFQLPDLNTGPTHPGGPLAADNPPRNSVSDVAAHDETHLWVITHHRRPDWLDFTIERAAPGLGTYLEPKDGKTSSIFRSRLDLLNLNSSAVVATSWHDGLLLRFIEPDLVLKLDYDDNGAPYLRVLRVTVQQ